MDRTRFTGYTLTVIGLAMVLAYLMWGQVMDFLGVPEDPKNLALVLGTGTTFLGIYTSVMSTERYVKAETLASGFSASLENLDRIISELEIHGRGIYLPNDYVGEPRVFLPVKKGDVSIPDLRGDPTFLTGADAGELGILISPPGHHLCSLLEGELEARIEDLEPSTVATMVPPLLSHGFGLASYIEIDEQEPSFVIRSPASSDLCERELFSCTRVGCPLCSCLCEALSRSMDVALRLESLEYEAARNRVSVTLTRVGT